MNIKSLVLALSILSTSSAFAQWFPGRVNVAVFPTQISAQVFNPFYEPLICNGQAFGQTTFGAVASSYFFQQVVPAGGYAFVYVYSNGFAPFINGWANINCRFARFF